MTSSVADLPWSVHDAYSWALATLLTRRHPEVRLGRGFGHGGMYDMLVLIDPRDNQVRLNRPGSIHVFRKDGQTTWEPRPLAEAISDDPRSVAAAIERAVGWEVVSKLPPSTPRVLVYRTLAALAALQTFSSPARIYLGLNEDDYKMAWIDEFPEVQARLRRDEALGVKYPFDGFWNYTHEGDQIAIEQATADAWSTSGEHLNLAQYYTANGRSMTRLLARVLNLAASGQ